MEILFSIINGVLFLKCENGNWMVRFFGLFDITVKLVCKIGKFRVMYTYTNESAEKV